MEFIESKMLYKEDKALKIKAPKAFTKKNLKEIRTVCNVKESKNDNIFIYEVKDITDYNRFLYFISREITNIIKETYFKPKLKESFGKEAKRIYDNHNNYSYEGNHFEFMIKARLLFFFKFNEELNILTFIKFNCSKIYEEYDLILEAEIECEGHLYDDVNTINILQEGEEAVDLSNRYNTLFQYIQGKEISKKIEDIHIFKDSNKYMIINENGSILNTSQTGINYSEIKNVYLENVNSEAQEVEVLGFYLGTIIALSNPERIIVYESLDEEFKTQVLVDVGILGQVLSIQTEVYTSEEKKPRM